MPSASYCVGDDASLCKLAKEEKLLVCDSGCESRLGDAACGDMLQDLSEDAEIHDVWITSSTLAGGEFKTESSSVTVSVLVLS